ncbi:hypothetical protein OIV83_000119 [Microbotryomycetes sp. JL201]|nr:hypothetical protein OIV83_000119 [Microbotryomycetes sp. JL201]
MAGTNTQVRLPPVHIPADDEPQQQGYMRRVSLSDPFLHAYPPPNSADPASHSPERTSVPEQPGQMGPPGKAVLVRPADGSDPARPGSPHEHQYIAGQPPATQAYSYSAQGYHPPPPPPPPHGYPPGVGQTAAPANYRFGGHGPHPYYDSPMRRPSIANSAPGGPHPPGSASGDFHPTPPGTSQKRKSAGEDTIMEESGYAPQPGQTHMGPGPYAKRRGSSLTYDKLGGLSLAEQQARRDSGMSSGGLSPWEDDRRGSNGSWTSVGSQNYSMSGYGPPHPAEAMFDPRGPPPPPGMYPAHPRTASGGYDAGMGQSPASEHMNYARRPSIGIDQLVEGGPGFGPPPMAHSYPRPEQGRPPSPQQMHPPLPNHLTASYAGGPPPPAPWARGPPPAAPVSVPHRASTGSLDPMTYGPASMIKDSPYSRSPELRVTHKLAERKRRKEMAQLFEDLKDSLPVERQLKSSKWEILSKAVEHIANLKTHNDQLLEENAILRQHLQMGPGSSSHPPHHPVGSHQAHGPYDGAEQQGQQHMVGSHAPVPAAYSHAYPQQMTHAQADGRLPAAERGSHHGHFVEYGEQHDQAQQQQQHREPEPDQQIEDEEHQQKQEQQPEHGQADELEDECDGDQMNSAQHAEEQRRDGSIEGAKAEKDK